jgi:hypothetical protein
VVRRGLKVSTIHGTASEFFDVHVRKAKIMFAILKWHYIFISIVSDSPQDGSYRICKSECKPPYSITPIIYGHKAELCRIHAATILFFLFFF